MKDETHIRRIFEDSTDLKITFENGELQSISGFATYQHVQFKLKIHLKNTGNPYRGPVNVIDPKTGHVLISESTRRKFLAAGKTPKDYSCRATKDVRCPSADIKVLAQHIQDAVTRLYNENSEQLQKYLQQIFTPDTIIPSAAAGLYAAQFVAVHYKNSDEKKNNSRRKTICRYYDDFPRRPMCEFTEADIRKFDRKHDLSIEAYRLLGLFWSYCISKRICIGKNPFPPDHRRRQLSIETRNHKVTMPDRLSMEQYETFFRLIQYKVDPLYCAVAMLLAGFDAKYICNLQISKIDIISGYADYIVVQFELPEIAGYKHNFTRPVPPEIARYIKRCIEELCKHTDRDVVKTWYIATHSDTPLDSKTLQLAAYNLLARAGMPPEALTSPRGAAGTRPFLILRNTYRHMLETTCGLAYDDDTLAYLLGSLIYSSTFTAYEEHTNRDALDRLYTALLPMALERKCHKKESPVLKDDRVLYYLTPDTNHEQISAEVSFDLDVNDSFSLDAHHGVIGTWSALGCDGMIEVIPEINIDICVDEHFSTLQEQCISCAHSEHTMIENNEEDISKL